MLRCRAQLPAARHARIVFVSLFLAGCAAAPLGGGIEPCGGTASCVASGAGRIEIQDRLLAERIERVAAGSASFRNDWAMIRASGVRVTIGRATRLHSQLPRWYRDNPNRWVGVTVVHAAGARSSVDRAVVALRVTAIERQARLRPDSETWRLAEIDRVLVHEIYGHLAPIIAAGDAYSDCPDHARPGEQQACVALREDHVMRELAMFQETERVAVAGAGTSKQQ